MSFNNPRSFCWFFFIYFSSNTIHINIGWEPWYNVRVQPVEKVSYKLTECHGSAHDDSLVRWTVVYKQNYKYIWKEK